MAGGTLRRHGLGVHGGGFCLVSHGSQARGLLSSGPDGPTVARLPRWAARTRRSGTDDAVAYRAPIALSRKASASTPKPLTANNPAHAREH
ncbi:MAG: hypothetical protein JWM45_26 [Pseudonocardiales bacterium]|nr:hypothetical protein [Pseudonocardiales bacterium]